MLTAWQLALDNVAKGKLDHSPKLTCDYCGDPMDSPENVTNKKYCSKRCQRDARYLREHGHRPTPKAEKWSLV